MGWRFKVSVRPIFPSRHGTIYEDDEFYSSLMICDLIVFSNLNCLSWSDGLRVISNESMDFNDPKKFDGLRYSMIPVIQWTLIIQSLRRYPHLRWSCLTSNHCTTGFDNHYLISLLVEVFSSPSTWIPIWNVSSSNTASLLIKEETHVLNIVRGDQNHKYLIVNF